MAVFLQPIFTQTVGSGGASSITFNNIPQTFTDLKLEVSARGTASGTWGHHFITVNNDSSTLYSRTSLYTIGTPFSASGRATATTGWDFVTGLNLASMTANTFGTSSLYLPNYTSANFKAGILEANCENNIASTDFSMSLDALLYRSTNAITSIRLVPQQGGNYVQNSTFSLYGILRQGV